jgi:hypothetical protein
MRRHKTLRTVFRLLQRLQRALNGGPPGGVYAPVMKELHTTDVQVVQGSVPTCIDGTYVRTGPNAQFDAEGGQYWCAFPSVTRPHRNAHNQPRGKLACACRLDGDGMVHAVMLRDGRVVAYCNHWLETPRYIHEKHVGHSIYLRVCPLLLASLHHAGSQECMRRMHGWWPATSMDLRSTRMGMQQRLVRNTNGCACLTLSWAACLQIGDLPGIIGFMIMAIAQTFPEMFPETDEHKQYQLGNTSLYSHNGKLLAMMDSGVPFHVKVDPTDGRVTSGGIEDFHGRINPGTAGHPCICPKTGVWHSFLSRCVLGMSLHRASAPNTMATQFCNSLRRACTSAAHYASGSGATSAALCASGRQPQRTASHSANSTHGTQPQRAMCIHSRLHRGLQQEPERQPHGRRNAWWCC